MSEFSPGDRPEDTMFRDAVDALRRGDKPRAKELLTLLIKADQNNPTYWIWLSASMDTPKERIYCLQTALNLDPENGTAKRGLVLLGALTPDETVQPFSLDRPRAWEEKLLLANEKPKEKGLRAVVKSPAARLAGIALIVAGLFAAVLFGFVLPRQTTIRPTKTNTPGPSPTFTATPTVFGAVAEATSTFIGPTPLWMLLPATYTPTPLYVNTPRPPQSMDQFRSAEEAYQNGDWDAFIENIELIIPNEPDSPDIYYMLGEAYRFKKQSANAVKAYNQALDADKNFGPAYLGLARARLIAEPDFDAEFLLDEAVRLDPNFGEVYLERARFFLNRKEYDTALTELESAVELMPESPEVYMTYARVYVEQDEDKKALEAAEKAYSLDITSLPVYRLLGELYIHNGRYQDALDALGLYVAYETDDATAFAFLGQAYYEKKDYKAAVEYLDKAYKLEPTGLSKFRFYRGFANLELDNIDQALEDLEKAYEVDETSFEINFAIMRINYIQEKFGTAYLKAESLKSLAETDEQTALVLYWHALIQEKRGEGRDAIRDWQALLAMDEDAMTAEMRADAETHLKSFVTATNTPKKPTATATRKPGTATPTPKVNTTPTATKTPKATATPAPTKTP